MLTLGVDLSAAAKRKASQHADKVGLDCPLGWPEPFVSFVTTHRSGHVAVADGDGADWRRGLAYRQTDEIVRMETGVVPLSVAADRLGHAAFRCAGLQSMLAAAGQDVDRCGGGKIVEVYPAAALRCWKLTHRGYKRRGAQVQLADLVSALRAATPWLDLGAFEAPVGRSHDAFDSVVAALVARAAAIGRTVEPDDGQQAIARSEGWIAMPTCPQRPRQRVGSMSGRHPWLQD